MAPVPTLQCHCLHVFLSPQAMSSMRADTGPFLSTLHPQPFMRYLEYSGPSVTKR